LKKKQPSYNAETKDGASAGWSFGAAERTQLLQNYHFTVMVTSKHPLYFLLL
jgi:hypothetical protein